MIWTQDEIYLPKPAPKREIRSQTRRHNHEHIVVQARSISGRKYIAEALNYPSRQQVADDIATGQIYDAQAVFAFNPFEGWARDISDEVAQMILDKFGITRSSIDFLEDQLGVVSCQK